MTEPRARAGHHKGQQNFTKELKLLMYAYGDDVAPLDETTKVFDEIVTDFIISSCHEAALCATHARRQKIKVDDFRFALRRDAQKLGRVQELLAMDRLLRTYRKTFNANDDRLAAATAAAAAAVAGGNDDADGGFELESAEVGGDEDAGRSTTSTRGGRGRGGG
ncbi:MAG: Transcription initiation factor TFIID subunit 13 [Peltula sp. TS41687]|nr:MAG: Transcription initiation factor TFIID subunit 13 [Peltula sp. TS41687]